MMISPNQATSYGLQLSACIHLCKHGGRPNDALTQPARQGQEGPATPIAGQTHINLTHGTRSHLYTPLHTRGQAQQCINTACTPGAGRAGHTQRNSNANKYILMAPNLACTRLYTHRGRPNDASTQPAHQGQESASISSAIHTQGVPSQGSLAPHSTTHHCAGSNGTGDDAVKEKGSSCLDASAQASTSSMGSRTASVASSSSSTKPGGVGPFGLTLTHPRSVTIEHGGEGNAGKQRVAITHCMIWLPLSLGKRYESSVGSCWRAPGLAFVFSLFWVRHCEHMHARAGPCQHAQSSPDVSHAC